MNLEMRKVNRLDVLCNCTSYEITRKVQESSEFELKCQFPSHQLGLLVSETERELRCCKEDGHLY